MGTDPSIDVRNTLIIRFLHSVSLLLYDILACNDHGYCDRQSRKHSCKPRNSVIVSYNSRYRRFLITYYISNLQFRKTFNNSEARLSRSVTTLWILRIAFVVNINDVCV